jgi:hypothetical protein
MNSAKEIWLKLIVGRNLKVNFEVQIPTDGAVVFNFFFQLSSVSFTQVFSLHYSSDQKNSAKEIWLKPIVG